MKYLFASVLGGIISSSGLANAQLLATPIEATSETVGEAFPLLPAMLENAAGEAIPSSTLQGKTVALYFSAHWCAPCRAFTPALIEFRNTHAADNFEVVFVSRDESSGERSRYIRETGMPWLMLPGIRSKDCQKLVELFKVRALPTLIVLRPDGSLVTKDGRIDLVRDPEAALAAWQMPVSQVTN